MPIVADTECLTENAWNGSRLRSCEGMYGQCSRMQGSFNAVLLRDSDDLGSAMHLVECKGRCQSSVSSSDYYHFSNWEATGSLRHLCKEG